MFGQLNDTEIEDVLKKNIIGRIGCHADGTTYIVPISYAYDGEYVYGHTQEGMKMKMVRTNPHICFEVDTMKTINNWKSVIAWGTFEEITEPIERRNAFKKLMERILPVVTSKTKIVNPDWPFSYSNLDELGGIVYRIKLDKKTGRFEKSDAATFYAS